MKTKLSGKFWCALTLFSLIGQIAWVVENMYLNVFIYKMFNASPSSISLMVAASAVSATLTTVLIGALSDKIGKRKLFMCAGYILWGISIFAFVLVSEGSLNSLFGSAVSAASAGASFVIVLDCIMTFFGSSANDAAFNAWLTDSTDSSNRGAAEGVNAMMPLVAILAVFGGFMAFDLNSSRSWTLIFSIIGACVLAVGILGMFIIKDPPIEPVRESYFKTVVYGFLPSTVKKNVSLYLHMACFVIFNISIQIFMPYLIIYYEESLKMTDYVFVMAPAIILASVVTFLWGKVYDKRGFTFSSMISMLWLCTGYVVLFFTRSTAPVFLGSLLMMCGYLSGMAVFGAKIRDLTPKGKSGMLQGVRICSQVLLPGIIGPFIGKEVLRGAQLKQNDDGTTSFIPNENIFLAALIVALIVFLFFIFLPKKKPTLNKKLKTPFEDGNSKSWADEYPRPGMKRDSHFSLCGEWELYACDKNAKAKESLGKIEVPFPPESRISGIERELKSDERYLYVKRFTLPGGFVKEKTLINFGAVDQIANVYLNGTHIGTHTGGYLPFTLDMTQSLRDGENTLEVYVTDELDCELAYGKQTKKRGGMWYTSVSGIWQSVWIESVCEDFVHSIEISTNKNVVTLTVIGGADEKTLTLSDGKQFTFSGESFTFEVENAKFWSPDSPTLYTFTLTSGKDKIESYFALRDVSVIERGGKKYIALNGEPILCHGLLDQGYFSDGIYTPKSPDAYLFDIVEMKKLGFNMLRKHIKIEPDIFYYLCDKHGMLVFQDMVNSGKYSFFVDTALPTVGMKRGISHKASKVRRFAFESSAKQTVDLLYNHPSVIYYTIFNEGWGQYDADRIYTELKAYDPSRIWDATSGWFKEKESDVESEHVYFKKLNLKNDGTRPLVLSEFGGYSYKIPEHSYNLDKTYGYRFFTDGDAFMDALEKLYTDEVIPAIEQNGLSAAVYTQVSDVEDETNGLYTYDRQVLKVDAERMKKISDALYKAFENK